MTESEATGRHIEDDEVSRLLRRVDDGWIPLLAHTLDCDPCRRKVLDHLTQEGLEEGPWKTEYEATSALASAVVARQDRVQRELEDDRRRAPDLAYELLLQPQRRRAELVAEQDRFLSPALAEYLLDKAAHERGSPARAEALARLALRIGHRLAAPRFPTPLADELVGAAWYHIADARRRQDDLDGAEAAYGKALESIDSLPIDAPVRAEFCRLLARLRMAQGRVDEALGLLRRAASLFAVLRDRPQLGLALGHQGRILLDEGDPEAVGVLSEALSSVPFEIWPWEAVRIRLSLALCLADWEPQTARKLLDSAEPQVATLVGKDRALLRWEVARVEARLKLPDADATFGAVIYELMLHAPYEAGQAALELAEFLVQTKELPEPRERTLDLLRTQVATLSGTDFVHSRAQSVLAVALDMVAEHGERAVPFLVQAGAYLVRARYNPDAGWPIRGALYWDDLDTDRRRQICTAAGLPADLAATPGSALGASAREDLSWNSAVRTGLALRFDAETE